MIEVTLASEATLASEVTIASSKITVEKSLSAMAAALTNQFVWTLREMRDLT
jgi:hypothetical protein